MPRLSPYLFCRYQLLGKDETVLGADEEFSLFQRIKGTTVAHRTRSPKKSDFDTYLLKPRKKQISGRRVHTWEVAKNIRSRERTRYIKASDETLDDTVETDEIVHTKFIGLPSLNVFAVDDKISERSLGARSACSRLKSIIENLSDDNEILISFAGSPEDTDRALKTWTLDRFSFTVRPFNPTPAKLGEKIHELLIADNVGKLQAVAYPDSKHEMRDSQEGIIAEAKGLSDAGYGQIAASGKTPSGVQATLSKPKFDMDKDKNKKHQAQNRVLKIYVEGGQAQNEEEAAVVRALIELYGGHTDQT